MSVMLTAEGCLGRQENCCEFEATYLVPGQQGLHSIAQSQKRKKNENKGNMTKPEKIFHLDPVQRI